MNFDLRLFCCALFFSMLFFSCSKDDENGELDDSDTFATFTLSGGDGGALDEGQYNGDKGLIGVNTNPEEGAAIDWSTHRPSGEDKFWRLDIVSINGANYPLEVGTYTLGNSEDFSDGNADFVVTFQSHTNNPPEEAFPFLWGGLGNVHGTLTITEIQRGVFDDGMNDLVIGTFEFAAGDNNYNGTIDQPPLSDIVVTNGAFHAKMVVF